MKRAEQWMLDDIPEDCKHLGHLTKNGCRIVCSSHSVYIIDHDCVIDHDGVTFGGCDAIVIDKSDLETCLIECTRGRFDREKALKAVEQLQTCLAYYAKRLERFSVIYIILYSKKKRVDSPAREYVRRGDHSLKGIIKMYPCGSDLCEVAFKCS
jgi:hypothetical protein